jgi:hypothetical protein
VSIGAAVVHRVQDVKNTVKPSQEVFNMMEDFITQVFTDVGITEHSLEPFSIQEVVDKTHNAKTQGRLRGVDADSFFETDAPYDVKVRAFDKAETYVGKAKERVISPVDDENLACLARYTYALKPFLKRAKWYCPGMTPIEVSVAVQNLIRQDDEVWETDYSNFDGTITQWLRRLEKRLYTRAFAAPGSKEVGECIARESRVRTASTRAGSYEPGGIRLSGSGLTTDGNTLLNAFMQYMAYRRMGKESVEAYASIGLCFGDDGVMTGSVNGHMFKVCESVGLVIKMLPACCPERPYVTFLGRVYPAPHDSLYSFQEPMRVWPKINLISRSNPVDEKERHAAKVASYLIIDGKTPILGAYTRKMLQLLPQGQAWLDRLEEGTLIGDLTANWFYLENRATVAQSWPQDEESAQAHFGLYCDLMGITEGQAQAGLAKINSASSLDELTNLFELAKPDVPGHIAIDGDAFTTGSPLEMSVPNNKTTKGKTVPPTKKVFQRRDPGVGQASTGSGAREVTNKEKQDAKQKRKGASPARAAPTQKRWVRSSSGGGRGTG